ncbi:MAG: hypothetical protein EZS28_014383 [Streblomastix strix]|uniref:Uncharacterized protein n=1 Tax=Streblomastix strix TaxID=222440 RepID=A0A5J4W5Z4_9EUKA|nr:MAG: hypothetical protein EZS28_014383 [Streblomastix strix]
MLLSFESDQSSKLQQLLRLWFIIERKTSSHTGIRRTAKIWSKTSYFTQQSPFAAQVTVVLSRFDYLGNRFVIEDKLLRHFTNDEIFDDLRGLYGTISPQKVSIVKCGREFVTNLSLVAFTDFPGRPKITGLGLQIENDIQLGSICIVKNFAKNNFLDSATGDETWVYLQNFAQAIWQKSSLDQPERPRKAIGNEK